jgi:multidrug efflux pump subunit AcrB
VLGYAVAAALVLVLVGRLLGTELFPQVDSGQFQLRMRAPPGTRIERTEELAKRALDLIGEMVGPENLGTTVAYGGISPSSYTSNNRLRLDQRPRGRPAAGRPEAPLGHPCRPAAGTHPPRTARGLGPWLRQQLQSDGMSEAQAAQTAEALRLSFEPADVINEVMSFGSGTPVEVVLSGPNFAETREYAARVKEEMAKVHSLRDLQYVQSLDYPTVEVRIDASERAEVG